MNATSILRTHWKWALLVPLVVVMAFAWGHERTEPAAAFDNEVNIFKYDSASGEFLGDACFVVMDSVIWFPIFEVCDNNIKGGPWPPVLNPIEPMADTLCMWKDGTPECEDTDPTPGVIRVSVDVTKLMMEWTLSVEEIQAPPGYNPDPMKYPCDLYGPMQKCDLFFFNDPKAPSEINITKTSRVDPQPVPGACFDVWNEFNTIMLFSVCDNDFQAGMPQSHPLCEVDGTPECEDSKPQNGSVQVAVQGGNYSVVESKPPMNHTADPAKKACDAKASKCNLVFENVVINAPTPWLPEDVTGDNAVSGLDFFAVLTKFGTTKP